MVTQVFPPTADSASAPTAEALWDAAAVERARAEGLSPRTVGALAGIFAALGEPTRLRIVHALSTAELCVGDLAAVLGLAVPAVSQHLRVLRDVRIVRNRRAGKTVYYSLDDAHVADLFGVALAHARGGEE